MRRTNGVAFCVLALCTLLGVAPEAGPDEALYRARFTAMMQGKGEYYVPLEAVPGAPSPTKLPATKFSSINSAALATAAAYARANNSSAFLVWHDGALAAENYFGGATADTPLVSKSLAKPLTAIVIGRAIALGKIRSLDQPVADFIIEWRGTPKAAILVRHLLDMRSGLLSQSMTTDPADILNRAYLHPRHDDILIHDYPLLHTPGTRFDYANAVADLVALVIERATGQRYAQFVSTQVLQPIGAAGGAVWIDRPGGLAVWRIPRAASCCRRRPGCAWQCCCSTTV